MLFLASVEAAIVGLGCVVPWGVTGDKAEETLFKEALVGDIGNKADGTHIVLVREVEVIYQRSNTLIFRQWVYQWIDY